MRHRLEFALFQCFKWGILILPLAVVQQIGSTLGTIFYHLIASRRAVALENLHNAFPDKSDPECREIAKNAFRNYAIAIAEFLWFPNLDDARLHKLVTVKNIEVMAEAHARGKGLIVLIGHFANWELAGLATARFSGLSYRIIVQTQSNKAVDRVINAHRCLFGSTVVPMERSVREILRSLQQGGAVAIAPDQSGSMEGVFVEFFGRRVATHQGPAVFSLRTGAPMFLAAMTRLRDGTYEIVLEKVPDDGCSEPTDENIAELTQRHTALLEKQIRLHPGQWLWMHRRWKHTWESVQREKSLAKSAIQNSHSNG